MRIIINLHRDLHEKLICRTRFSNDDVLKRIQNYLTYYITYYRLINALPEEEDYDSFELHIKISANGKTITEHNLDELLKAVSCLGEYDGFELEVRYQGRTGEIYCDFGDIEMDFPDVLNNYDGMLEYLRTIEDPDFEYVMADSCDVDGGASMYWIDKAKTPDEGIVRMHIADTSDDLCVCETGEYNLFIKFDFEKNRRQCENIKAIITEYADTEDELEISREMWEEDEWIGFINLLSKCCDTGCYVQMLERINEELRSVEGDIEIESNGALYDVDDFVYAYLTTDEDNQIFLVVLKENAVCNR